jgi:hypothetical protein
MAEKTEMNPRLVFVVRAIVLVEIFVVLIVLALTGGCTDVLPDPQHPAPRASVIQPSCLLFCFAGATATSPHDIAP